MPFASRSSLTAGSAVLAEVVGPDGQLQRKRSSADLGINYPGDLLSQVQRKRAVPPLLKRNTIADFETSKAYQVSTASLMSGGEPQGGRVGKDFS